MTKLNKKDREWLEEHKYPNVVKCDMDSYHVEQKISQMQMEKEELKAHINTLRSELKGLVDNIYNPDVYNNDEVISEYFNSAKVLLNKTPKQSLDDIKANAIEGLNFPVALRKMWSGGEVKEWLKSQAKQLREGTDE